MSNTTGAPETVDGWAIEPFECERGQTDTGVPPFEVRFTLRSSGGRPRMIEKLRHHFEMMLEEAEAEDGSEMRVRWLDEGAVK